MSEDKHANRPDLLVFVSFSGDGGVERLLTRLLNRLVDVGLHVEVMLIKDSSHYTHEISEQVVCHRVRSGHNATSIPELARYMRRRRPRAVMAVKDRAIRAAVRARRLARVDMPLIGALHTTLLAALAHKSRLSVWLRIAPMRRLYRHLDRVITVSEGVAHDTMQITGLPAERIEVVRNPVVTPDFDTLAAEPSDHPWLQDPDSPAPVILGLGRLTRQKDFPTLLQAFAIVRKQRQCRLIIAGEGSERVQLESLARTLGVAEDVSLPGFLSNPYPVIQRCALFVLSSAWEGSGNVLTEALALGRPVVSTDCPSGPREMLEDGRYGRLTPVGDVKALAQAMQDTLDDPPDGAFLKQAVHEYTVEYSTHRYMEVLGLTSPNRPD